MKGIVVCPQPRAADVGAEILSAGGNAFDAAVVVAAFFAVAKAAGPVTSVWRVFLGYNLLRCSQFALRVTSTALRRRKTA